MNYLQLAQFVHRQLAVGNEQTGTKPIDVTIPTGPLAEICASVNDAYRDIQNEQEQWKFRTKQGTLNLTPNGTNTISLATIQGQITDYDRLLFFTPNSNRYLRSYLSSAGATTSGYCYFMPYQCWRGWQDAGTLPSGQPQQFTQLPDQSLQFYPTPDAGDVSNTITYKILLDYYRSIDTLVVNTDIPIMPSDFHEAIGWKAVAYLATSKLPPDRYMLAMREYERIMNNMRHSQLPEELLDLTEFYA